MEIAASEQDDQIRSHDLQPSQNTEIDSAGCRCDSLFIRDASRYEAGQYCPG